MTQWKDLLAQSDLDSTLNVITDSIKDAPKDADLRSIFIELLCVKGDYERADEQLMQSIKLFPEYLAGASQLRHLVKAAQARADFASGAASAQILGTSEQMTKSQVDLNLAFTKSSYEQALALSREIELGRTIKRFVVNGTEKSDVRDIDDRLGGYIELFSSKGNYFLVPISNVVYLELKPAKTILENIWRPIEFEIEGLGEGEAHMPLTYIDSETNSQKLARETDWKPFGEEVFVGQGQKCFLAGDDLLPICDLRTLELQVEVPQ
ncbi:type VI secretion system accessory protein TagJ [Vibrio rotiferianus]|uniref:type VI secretion system accessory protein TagJ n=1 Tax=Vibrio rotiferianus TaxID=190895 RepID=UPI00406A6E3F